MQNLPLDSQDQRSPSPQLRQELGEMFPRGDPEQKRHLDWQNTVDTGYGAAEATRTHQTGRDIHATDR